MSERLRLWDREYRMIWDSRTATTPAYRHISTWCHATIDYPDGTRWDGQLYRCAEGIIRWSYDDLSYIVHWPNPILDETGAFIDA